MDTIDKYLISNYLLIIDEFNDRYKEVKDKISLKQIADTEFSEADLVVRLGYPFKNMANFNMQGSVHDIVVKEKDFIIEVKYLRNFKSGIKKNFSANKTIWADAFQKDYDWLCKEIKDGHKGKRAFVLSWFNAVDRFSEIMQLGEGKGGFPNLNEKRIRLLPFINYDPDTLKTKDIFYMYKKAYENLSIQIPGYDENVVNCIFVGKKEGKFHMAILVKKRGSPKLLVSLLFRPHNLKFNYLSDLFYFTFSTNSHKPHNRAIYKQWLQFSRF
ncbi:MAG TPA: hypothetical protein VIK26_00160 [Clostridium sp.]